MGDRPRLTLLAGSGAGTSEPSYGNSYCPSVAQVLDALTMAERPASERQLRRWWLRGWVDDDALHLRLQQLADAGITLCVRTPWGPRWTFLLEAARLGHEEVR